MALFNAAFSVCLIDALLHRLRLFYLYDTQEDCVGRADRGRSSGA